MSKFGFGAKAMEWNAKKRKALQYIAIDALGEFNANFDNQKSGRKKWKEVQRRIPGTEAYKKADAEGRTRPILEGETGQLRDNMEIGVVTSDYAEVYNTTPYAQLQNEGGVNSNGGVVPARPFMVQTDKLTRRQLKTLKEVTGEIWSVK